VSDSPSRVQAFRGRFSLLINVGATAAALILFVVVLASTIANPPKGGSETGAAAVASVAILVFAVLLVRACRAATLLLRPNDLVYRSLLRTRHIPRSQVVGVRIEKSGRSGGLMKGWIPIIDLGDSSSLWLTEMRAVVQSSLDGPDYYGPYTERMMDALRKWAAAA